MQYANYWKAQAYRCFALLLKYGNEIHEVCVLDLKEEMAENYRLYQIWKNK